jgi:hypothetical protein
MLLLDAPFTFGEFVTDEQLPLATLFREILGFLAERRDAVLFGAQAVNAYCEPARMTADVDVLTTDAPGLAEALRSHLAERFHIAVRVRRAGGGLRIYQLRTPVNRHLVDVRPVDALPESRRVEGVDVVSPVELAAMKAIGLGARRESPKGDTDRADLRRLLLAFPELKTADGVVSERLAALGASPAAFAAWDEVVRAPIASEADDDW